jgi:hypothetical protein
MSNKSKKHYRNTSQFKSKPSAAVQNNAEFNPDYTDVIKDLKRIGTLAVTFFVILIALSFVL